MSENIKPKRHGKPGPGKPIGMAGNPFKAIVEAIKRVVTR